MSLTDILSPSDIAAALRDCQGEQTIKTQNLLLCVTRGKFNAVPKEY